MDEHWNNIIKDKELLNVLISFPPECTKEILLKSGYDFTLEEIIDTAKELNEIILLCSGDSDDI